MYPQNKSLNNILELHILNEDRLVKFLLYKHINSVKLTYIFTCKYCCARKKKKLTIGCF